MSQTEEVALKYSDHMVDWLVELGYTHCFFVAGGNIMHLLDSARTRVKCVPVVHEVAAGIAVEYFNQMSVGRRAFALVTAGPGLTNIVTAISGAWLENRELLVIGGQVKSADLMSGGLRQRGIQEVDGVSIVKSITKHAIRIEKPIDEASFKGFVEDGYRGRRGPVFIEACLDAQGAHWEDPKIEVARKISEPPIIDNEAFARLVNMTRNAERPAWLIGAGIDRDVAWSLRTQLEGLEIPVLTTWHGADRISSKASNYFGRPETWGQRLGNMLINQADLLVVFGARLGFQETGFNWQEYAKNAEIVQIEIDKAELHKGHPRVALSILGDANAYLVQLLNSELPARPDWLTYCRELRDLLPLNESFNETHAGFVSPYDFYLEASEFSGDTDVWVPASSGGANSVAIQALNQWGNQKVICDNGLASMGYGLSGAIGASFAEPSRRVWLVEGDGGFTQNLQELATVSVNELNIKMFIFSNEGYGSIRTTQKNYFAGEYLGCDTNTGLGFPNWKILAEAYGLDYFLFESQGFDNSRLRDLLNADGPLFVEVPIDPLQTYWPKITSRVTETGGMESNPLYRMSPELPREIAEKVSKYLW
jgi:acetolactate synthase-1/2/3 large subunit